MTTSAHWVRPARRLPFFFAAGEGGGFAPKSRTSVTVEERAYGLAL